MEESKVVKNGLLRSSATFEDRGHVYEIGPEADAGLLGKALGWRLQLTGTDAPLVFHYNVKATSYTTELSDGRTLSFAPNKQILVPDSLLQHFGGNFKVGVLMFTWRPVNGRQCLSILSPSGEKVATATKPWQESQKDIDWLIQWHIDIEDAAVRIAILLAPWMADRIARFPSGD